MRQQATDTLDALDRAFLNLPTAIAVSETARERALGWARAAALRPGSAENTISLAFAVEMLLALPPTAAADCAELRQLVDAITALTGAPRSVLAKLVFARLPTTPRGPDAHGEGRGGEYEGDDALGQALALGLVLLDAREISIWQARSASHQARSERPVRLAVAGQEPHDRRDLCAAATELLADDGPAEYAVSEACGVRIASGPHAPARALVCAGGRQPNPDRFTLLRTVGAAVSQVRDLAAPGERQVSVSTAERRLTQLRFDLHDGPLQDVVLLGEDLSMFTNQLEDVLVEHPLRERIIGRLDDLQAMLVALNGDLRRVASLLESPFLRSQSFSESLAQIANAFAQRTETIPELELHGDLDQLSDSHCITLLALIREALNNIREHSQASRVSIAVSSGPDGVIATVFDDGRGFDPEQELIRAARGGHLGLVGMHERVRVLGGVTSIESRPGGPTVISVNLPHTVAGP
jgi:signal transduction histidine kinase